MKEEQASKCGDCGSEKPWLLHNISLRSECRRFCSSCVLKTHVGLFCPICFEVYEGISASNDRVKCLKCPSHSHMACVSEDARSTYVCSSCSNPSFVFFDIVGSSSKKDQEIQGGEETNRRAIDLKSAKILVAAAKISSISMSKAANMARIHMENRVKEAASSRKRAREALERLVYVGNKAKERRIASPSPVVPVMEQQKEQKKKSKDLCDALASQNIRNQDRAMGNNRMEAVSVIANGIRSNIAREGSVGSSAPNLVQRPSINVASTSEAGEVKGCAPVNGSQQHHGPEKISDKKVDNLVHLLNHVLQEEKDNDGSLPDATAPTPPSNPPENDHGVKEEQVKSKALADEGKTID